MIKNRTIMTKNKFLKSYLLGFRSVNMMIFITVLSLLTLYIIGRFIYILSTGSNGSFSALLMMLVVVFLILLFDFNLLYLKPSKIFKKNCPMIYDFTFETDYFDLTSEITKQVFNHHLQYSFIKKIYETKDAFYLFTRKQGVLTVDKDGFQQGMQEEFRNILLSNRQ